MKLDFDPGFDITPLSVDEGFRLGADCFDKGTEFRKLDSVRKSLRDPNCDGPENVYAIMMDVAIPQPRTSIQPSPLHIRQPFPPHVQQETSTSALGSVNGKWCGRRRIFVSGPNMCFA